MGLTADIKRLQAEGKSSAFINKFINAQSKNLPSKSSKKTITLNKPKTTTKDRVKEVKRRSAKALDVLSSILLEPTTFIKNPSKAGDLVAARRADITKTKDIGKALDVVGETLTATAIGAAATLGIANPAVAGKLALKALPKTLKGQIGALTGVGILTTSESARNLAGKFFQDPTKIGREAGLIIDKALTKKDVGTVAEAFQKAGIIGAVVAGGVGAIALGKKFLGGGDADKAINVPGQVPSSVALPVSPIPS